MRRSRASVTQGLLQQRRNSERMAKGLIHEWYLFPAVS
jgi:hypothetical protein